MADRTLVSVQPSSRSNFRCGFYTNIDLNDQATLGHVIVTGGLGSGVIFGANSPKPARMRKVLASGRSTSSFVDSASRSSAASAGWRLVKRAMARSASNTTYAKAVYTRISVGSGQTAVIVQYGWMMPLTTYTAIGAANLSSLGIKDVTATEDRFDLVFGSTPKPPRATNKATGVSTFCDPDAVLPAGWSFVGGEQE